VRNTRPPAAAYPPNMITAAVELGYTNEVTHRGLYDEVGLLDGSAMIEMMR